MTFLEKKKAARMVVFCACKINNIYLTQAHSNKEHKIRINAKNHLHQDSDSQLLRVNKTGEKSVEAAHAPPLAAKCLVEEIRRSARWNTVDGVVAAHDTTRVAACEINHYYLHSYSDSQ